jgi:hypothetical protein
MRYPICRESTCTLKHQGWPTAANDIQDRIDGGKMIKKMGNKAVLIGLAFLLGSLAIGCEKETTTTVPVQGAQGPAGDPGAPGATGAQGAASAPAPPQVTEKTSESSITTSNDRNPGGNTTSTDKTTTTKSSN